jgi:hypothetical protein
VTPQYLPASTARGAEITHLQTDRGKHVHVDRTVAASAARTPSRQNALGWRALAEFVTTWLTAVTRNPLAPGFYVLAAAAVGTLAVVAGLRADTVHGGPQS